MKKFIILLNLGLSVLASFGQFSNNRRIDQFSFEYKNDKIYISYKFANCKEDESFLIRVEAYKKNGDILIQEAKSFTGNINKVSGNGTKQIIWDILKDGIILNNEEIYIKIYATLIPIVELRNGIIASTILPGSGLKYVGAKNHSYQGYIGYGLLGGGIGLALMANSEFNNYRNGNDQNTMDKNYASSQQFQTLAITSFGLAACIWAWNYFDVSKNANKNQNLKPEYIINNSYYESISGITLPKNVSAHGLPPALSAELIFNDANNNDILEALEKSELSVVINNQGKGFALKLHVSIKDEQNDPNLKILNDQQDIPIIEAGKSVTIKVPIEAGIDIKTEEHKIKIEITEFFHFDMDPVYLKLQTYAYQSSKIVFNGFEIIDSGEGTAPIEADGQIQTGEQVKLKLTIQNVGLSIAKNINYKISTANNEIILLDDKSGTLGEMEINQSKDFYITLQVTKRYTGPADLPLFLSITEELHKGDLSSFQIPVTLNKKPPQMNVLNVQSDLSTLQNNTGKLESNPKKFISNVNVINIKTIIPSISKRPKSIGVVFGIRNYSELPPAPYADNDANLMKEYFKKVLGVEQVISFTNKEASGFIFDNIFNPDNGDLQKAIVKGETEVFVYYSGHGIPDKTGDNTYLFPSDGKIQRLDQQGYNTEKLYENLAKLGAKHVTVILDACFSGASRPTQTIQIENLVAQKGIKIKPKKFAWNDNPTFTIINSSSADETSLGYDATESGLFTYFLCAGLQGNADTNGDKKITLGELKKYVIENVMEASKKITGLQTPIFFGDENTVLVKY